MTTIDDINNMIGNLQSTLSNLQDILSKLDQKQLREAYDCVTEAEDTIDDFIFEIEDSK